MFSKKLRLTRAFSVAHTHKNAQMAEMVIAPGKSEGGPGNAHRGADQWLFVVEGEGTAIVEGKRRRLSAGVLLLVERGERHEIRNSGRTPLRTINFYSPLAYDSQGNARSAGRPHSRS